MSDASALTGVVEDASGAPVTDEATLGYTNDIRHRLVKKMTEGGQMPEENKDRLTLLTALDGIDRIALTKMKIGAKERTNQTEKAAAQIITAMINQMAGTKPFQIEAPLLTLPPPSLDDSQMEPLEILDGETAIGIESEGYESFGKRMGLIKSEDD